MECLNAVFFQFSAKIIKSFVSNLLNFQLPLSEELEIKGFFHIT